MTLVRMIAPNWLLQQDSTKRRVIEGEFNASEIKEFNEEGYNIYILPNHPKEYDSSSIMDGTHINVFNCVFVDFDLKSESYESKEKFLEKVASTGITPTRIVDSGNGIHCYWNVADLDAKSYLKIARRLMRLFKTDDAVQKIFQLMRMPGTINTKVKDDPKQCTVIYESDSLYTCEELDKLLPTLTKEDEQYCTQHYDKTYNMDRNSIVVNEVMPSKWGKLLRENQEAKQIWSENALDRSKNDFRLGHIMYANGFTKEEATSVLVNSAKASTRAPVHRISYASNIVDKIWVFEEQGPNQLSESVADLLAKNDSESLKGYRFKCHNYFDGTDHGFRLTQVIGLCAGVGVGKTAIGLNMFMGFVKHNPDFVHLFVSLEQPAREIAQRWQKMTSGNTELNNKVHVLSNYNADGTYRNLSLTEIQSYIVDLQKTQGIKIGCVCIDHIGVLKQESKPGEYQGLRDICAQLKSFAIATETLLIIQSQTNRDKAGIGDLELYKDAAFGSQSFESYVDFLCVAWQPLKRCYDNRECPRVTAYKFAKIRFKSKTDVIVEDQCYRLYFDQDTETLRPMTQEEETLFDIFANQAIGLRKRDRKTDLVAYKSVKWETDVKPDSN
jgi:DnaB-like helicase C terminal domain